MSSAPRQTAFRDPAPGNTFLGASQHKEYIAFPTDTLAGSGIALMCTVANDAGGQHVLTCTDVVGNASSLASLEEQFNAGNTDNKLFAYIATTVIPRGLVSVATTGSDATHLVDSTQSWVTNEWVGKVVLDYLGNTRTVTSNTSTTLTVSSGVAISSGGQYVLGGWIRVDFDAFGDFAGLAASEVSGVTSIIASSHAYPTVGSGTDNISSGSKALGSSPVGIWSGCYCDTAAAAPGASSRSGTTNLGTSWVWNQGAASTRFQFRNVANPGTLDATFSSTGSNNFNTFMVAFLDATSGQIADPTHPTNPPGASHGMISFGLGL